MNVRLEKKLFEKYPGLFRLMREQFDKWEREHPKLFKNLEEKQIIYCEDGWYWLLDNLCCCIQNYIDRNKSSRNDIEQVRFIEVKEKFGELLCYPDKGNWEIRGMIAFATHLSHSICERCGKKGARKAKNKENSVKTLCEDCVLKSEGYGYV